MLTPSPTNGNYGYLVWLGSGYIKIGEVSPLQAKVPVAPEVYLTDDMVVFLGLGEQRVWISPSNDLVIVRGTDQWAPSWDESRIPNLILKALQTNETAG
jgi:hypothetical protein